MTHWKQLTNPNYLGAYALEPGEDKIVTIDFVREETVIGADGKKDDCLVMHLRDGDKPMILNSTNAKTIQKIYGTPYVEEWAGRKIQLYIAQVKAFGEVVDALRIRPYIPKEEKYTCDDCKKEIKPYGKMTAADVAKNTMMNYGRMLCSECGTKAKKAKEAKAKEGDVLAAEQ